MGVPGSQCLCLNKEAPGVGRTARGSPWVSLRESGRLPKAGPAWWKVLVLPASQLKSGPRSPQSKTRSQPLD